MAHVILTERDRAALCHRIAGVNVSSTPARRRVDRVWDALKLDELPKDSIARLNTPAAVWVEGSVEYPITSAMRDDLIEWLEPTDNYPMTAFMARVVGAVFDALKDSRDGHTILTEE